MIFRYRALKKEKVVKGKVDANNIDEAVSYLKSNGYFPIEVKKESKTTISFLDTVFNRVKVKEISLFTRQLSIMINAGLTLVDALDIMKKQTKKSTFLKVLNDIHADVVGGKSFSETLKKFPDQFSNMYIALIKAGEASGKLNEVLSRLAETLEKQEELHSKTRGALLYPMIIILGIVAVIFIVMIFVIPQLQKLYNDLNVELPLPTQVLIVISTFFVSFWPLIIGALGGVYWVLNKYLKTAFGKYSLDKVMFQFPVIGQIIQTAALVDTTRALAILISAGVSIIDSLQIVIEVTDNMIYKYALKNVITQVTDGITLGTAMQGEGVFPPILVQMVNVGEQTGHMDDTLLRISHYFELESEFAVKTLTTLIEPITLVFLGVTVGLMVLAVITPLYSLTNAIK